MEEGGGDTCGPQDVIYEARRDLVFATTKFRQRHVHRRRGPADRQVEIVGGMISLPN